MTDLPMECFDEWWSGDRTGITPEALEAIYRGEKTPADLPGCTKWFRRDAPGNVWKDGKIVAWANLARGGKLVWLEGEA